MNEELAEARGLRPGDTPVMSAYAADQFFELLEGEAALGNLPPRGPRLDFAVTGVVRHPRHVTPYASDDEVVYLSKQNLLLTPAFHRRYVETLIVGSASSLVAVAVAVALGGAVLALVVAVAASPLLPVGLARLAEPDPGVSVDGVALGTGLVATVVLVMTMAGVAARWSSRLPGSPGASVPVGASRPSAIARPLTGAGLVLAGNPAVYDLLRSE